MDDLEEVAVERVAKLEILEPTLHVYLADQSLALALLSKRALCLADLQVFFEGQSAKAAVLRHQAVQLQIETSFWLQLGSHRSFVHFFSGFCRLHLTGRRQNELSFDVAVAV